MAVRWSLAVGLLYYAVRRYGLGAWVVVGGLVASHWLLDLLVHRPDLPLWPGGPKYGLGQWNSWAAPISAEVLVFGLGISLYVSATHARDGVGKYGFWGLMAFLLLGWLAAAFGPPPQRASVSVRSYGDVAIGAVGVVGGSASGPRVEMRLAASPWALP